MNRVDLIVLGAGLAGCAVAWQAHQLGMTVLLIDRLDENSSSRVAAGLVTPITGTRAAASWRWQEFYPVANIFYTDIEKATSCSFWYPSPALRIFETCEECKLYEDRWISHREKSIETGIEVYPYEASSMQSSNAPFGVCMMQPASRLDTCAFLQATQTYFQSISSFRHANVDVDCDVRVESAASIAIPSLDVRAPRMVLCQGFAARENRYFDRLPLHPARGDIITVKSPSVKWNHVVHGQAWAVPLHDSTFLVGATYDRQTLNGRVEDDFPAAVRFRIELMRRWEQMVGGSFDDGDHQFIRQRAAVRPASFDRHPLIGAHPVYPNVFCLNGLGSKGTLMAPHLAKLLLQAAQGDDSEPALVWNRRK